MDEKTNQDDGVSVPKYSLVDERNYYTSTINCIPLNLSSLKQSEIPFTLNITPELFQNDDVPVSEDDIVRCSACKSYVNPFIEVIPPGFKWKCNICMNESEIATPFQSVSRNYPSNKQGNFSLLQNAIHNHNTFSRTELTSTVYELHAPSNYSVRTPSPLIFCFIIEVTYESIKHGMFQVIIRSIQDNIDYTSFDSRSRMVFIFYNSQTYILNTDLNLTIIPDASFIPYLQEDQYMFNLKDKIDFTDVEHMFLDSKSIKNNYGDALKIAHKLIYRSGGSILSFLTTYPNYGSGRIENTSPGSLKCNSVFYKELAVVFAKNIVSVTHFLFPRVNIELPTISILSKNTGGMIFYYPNFDGGDPVFSTKLHNDLNIFFDLSISHDCVCRIRTSRDVFIKEYNGSLNQRSLDLLSFSNFFPPHSFNIDLEVVDNIKADGLSLQVALMRTTKAGNRMIRVINIQIPQERISIYDCIDPYAISRSLATKAFYYESQRKDSGSNYMFRSLISILKAYKNINGNFSFETLPYTLNILPMLILSISKSIPLRPVSYTPIDYRSYYMYLMSVSYPKLTNTIIYPTLIPLCNEEDICSQNLTLDLLKTNGLYLLDTGVTIYFFVGKDCPKESAELLFDSSLESGRIIFEPPQNEFSTKVLEIINELRKDRFLTPFYVLVRDDGKQNLFKDIFFTYFYEDHIHNSPSFNEYIETLKRSLTK